MADNRIAYGLCEELGIDTNGMEPYECWKALKEHGITPNNCEEKLRDLKREKADRIYGTSNDGNTESFGQNGIPPMVEAMGFENLNTPHHRDHAKDFGYKDMQAYKKAAIDYFNNGEGTLYYSKARKRFARYNASDGKYVVCDPNSANIYTFYKIKPTKFQQILKQEGYVVCT